MLTFSEYCLIEQKLLDLDVELDEGVWEFLGKHLSPKPVSRERMNSDVLKVNNLKDPKKVAELLHPTKSPLHVNIAAARHPDLSVDDMKDAVRDDRHHRSVTNILSDRLEKLAAA